MFGHLGFSYIGLLFLLMLFIPNIIWTGKKPQGYSSQNENKILVFLERAGEVLTCCCSLMFSDFNIHKWTNWSWWLIAAFILMVMYELWWIRYFRSERKLEDFYSDFFLTPKGIRTISQGIRTSSQSVRTPSQGAMIHSKGILIPLAGATLPVAAFFMLGMYGKVIWMLIATVILGIGHIGIHAQHKKELDSF